MTEPYDILDFERFDQYCATHADEYGGRFADGDLIFGVLFTDHVDDHEAALRRVLSHPELLTVRAADRPWREIESANRRLQQQLILGTRHPAVNGVGISMHDGQFRITVSLDPAHVDATDEIIALAQPEQITVNYRTAIKLHAGQEVRPPSLE